MVFAVRRHHPAAPHILQLYIQNLPQLLALLGYFDGHHHFDAAFQVAGHQIGGANEKLFFAAVAEIINPRMFQKPADDTGHRDVVGKALDPRQKPAGIADHKLHRYPRLRGAIEGLGDVRVLKGVGLEADQAIATGFVAGHLALDLIKYRLFGVDRRDQQLAVAPRRLASGGQEIEKLRQVATDLRIAAQQSQVGIAARRTGVIVAGGDMGIAPEPIEITADHQDHLRMGLQSDHPVIDVNAEFLEPAGPLDVGGFVEARL